MRPHLILPLGGAALLCATVAPASRKPCRGPDGTLVVCAKAVPKPKPAPTRCKDEKGRFIACGPPVHPEGKG